MFDRYRSLEKLKVYLLKEVFQTKPTDVLINELNEVNDTEDNDKN